MFAFPKILRDAPVVGTKRDTTAAGRYLDVAMTAARVNQAELAKMAGVDPATVSDFIAGKRWPTAKTRGAIEGALTLDPGTLARVAETGESYAEIATRSAEWATPRLGESLTVGVGGSVYVDPHHRTSRGLTVDDYELVQQAAQVLGEAATALTAAVAILTGIHRPSALDRGDDLHQPE